jgi:hypothetical protein
MVFIQVILGAKKLMAVRQRQRILAVVEELLAAFYQGLFNKNYSG